MKNTSEGKARKITKATFKSFVKRNLTNLYVNVKSDFDGMVDGIQQLQGGFEKASISNMDHFEHTLNISGVWLVGGSRDYFKTYEDDIFRGIECSNCCGCFVVVVNKKRGWEYDEIKRGARSS